MLLEEDFVKLMKKSGFKNIGAVKHIVKQSSVRNWLKNGGLPKDKQEKIFEMHVNSSDLFKKEHNLLNLKDDCLIDLTYLIVVGEK